MRFTGAHGSEERQGSAFHNFLINVMYHKLFKIHQCGHTSDEISCHQSSSVTSFSKSLYSEVVFLSALQGAQLAAGLVGGAAFYVAR